MKLLSVNVGMPREVEINGQAVLTGIYKHPVSGPVRLRRLSLEGDGQADLKVHGGEYQAAYSYPFEHYDHWQKVLGVGAYPPGTFGENFTVSGLMEDEIYVGDIFRFGTAAVQVTIPRLPCFKFAQKIGRSDILKEFLQSGKSGFYHRVIEEGVVEAGNQIELLERDPRGITVRQLLGMSKFGEGDDAMIRRALECECLPPAARAPLEARLANAE